METRGRSTICGAALLALLAAAMVLPAACNMPSGAASSAGPASPVAPTVLAVTPGPQSRPAVAADLSEAALKNGAYQVRDLGKVQLSDGQYKEQYGSGATQVNQAVYVSSATGDLNDDGADDAAVVLAGQSGGSGSFYNLVVVLSDDGAPKQAGADFLGDRIKLESLAIERGQVVVRMLKAGPKDPLCCPSTKIARTYALRSGSLLLLSETVEAPKPTAAIK